VCVKAVRALAMQGDARHQIKVRTLAAYP
jgi:hypothetical protein